jgi:DNA-directed RNA polymerase subunit E'/Rpb7
MFHRYKQYANTVIKDIEFGSTLGILPNTPLEHMKQELGLVLDPEHENFWESTTNPTLTFKERIRRRIVASQTAESLGYKFSQDQHKELLMNFWQLYKNKKQIIPIKNIKPEQTLCT